MFWSGSEMLTLWSETRHLLLKQLSRTNSGSLRLCLSPCGGGLGFLFIVSGVRLSLLVLAATAGLLYLPQMIDEGDSVEKLLEIRLAGETEVLWENLPQRHSVHHKSHMTRPGFEYLHRSPANADALICSFHPKKVYYYYYHHCYYILLCVAVY
jgi:hypothetical protein